MSSQITEIELPVCHSESKEPMTEIVEVVKLGANRYRLIYSPGVVEGLAKGDEIELCSNDPKGFRVLKRGGNLCVWFYFERPGTNRGSEGNRVRSIVEEFGGIGDGGGNTHLIFSIPISLGFAAVESLFENLINQYPGSTWLFGNVYDPFNDFQPLGCRPNSGKARPIWFNGTMSGSTNSCLASGFEI